MVVCCEFDRPVFYLHLAETTASWEYADVLGCDDIAGEVSSFVSPSGLFQSSLPMIAAG